jgi:hypothetical protein
MMSVTGVEGSLGDASRESGERGARGAIMAELVATFDFLASVLAEY